MKIYKIKLCFAAIFVAFFVAEVSAEAGKRSFTTFDSFSRTELIELNYEGYDSNPFLFSSDGRKLFFVISKGDVNAMTYHFKLLMFDVSEIANYLKSKNGKPPQPEILAESSFRQKTLGMSYFANNRGIKKLTLTSNPDELAFISADKKGIHQLFRVNIKTRQLEQITSLPTHVTDFVIFEKRNEALVTTGDYARQDVHCDDPSYSVLRRRLPSAICFDSGESLMDKLVEQEMLYPPFGPAKLYKIVMTAGAAPVLVARGLWLEFGIRPVQIFDQVGENSIHRTLFPSPDQSKVLLRTFINGIPDKVRHSAEQSAFLKFLRPSPKEDNYTHVSAMNNFYSFYTLIDLQNNTYRPYIDLPIVPMTSEYAASWPKPIWTSDHTVFIPELFPIQETPRVITAQSAAPPAGRGTLINTEADRYEAYGTPAFEAVGDSLIAAAQLEAGKSPAPVSGDTARNCELAVIEEPNGSPAGCYIDNYKIKIRIFNGESHKSLPNIYAMDLTNDTTKLLYELNPQLAQVSLSKFESFITQDDEGKRVGVAVYLPPNYRQGKRYPVVVGGNLLVSEKYPFEGPGFLTAPYATQSLASNGIIVMYNFTPKGESERLPQARASSARAVNAGLRLLDQKKMIDLSKIGMMGFSATGSFAFDMALHPEYPIEALIVTDATSPSPLGYMWTQHMTWPSIKTLDDLHCGARPWGHTRTEWLQRNPYFNLDKLTSAVLIYENWSGLTDWLDIVYGLEWLKKPVDAILFRNGQHPTVDAYDRYAQQELTVDWFTFWLNGTESDNPTKAEQYERWRKLRELKRAAPPISERGLPLSKMDCPASLDSKAS